MIHDGPAIHEKAHVDLATCALGDGTFVWQFASVIRGATIGQCCVIAACAIVDGAQLGDSCLIGHGASLHPGTRLEGNIFVGPGVIFCNDRWPRAWKEGFDADGLKDKATVIVKEGASIGAGSIILPGVVIGPGAIIAAGVICERSVPGHYLLRRDGSLEPVPEDLKDRRMKWAT